MEKCAVRFHQPAFMESDGPIHFKFRTGSFGCAILATLVAACSNGDHQKYKGPKSLKMRVIGLLHNATSHESQFFAAYLIRKYLRNLDSAWTLSAAVAAHPLVVGNLKRVQKFVPPRVHAFSSIAGQSRSPAKTKLTCHRNSTCPIVFRIDPGVQRFGCAHASHAHVARDG